MSKNAHSGVKYGVEDYFEYHVQGVVTSLTQHNLPDEYLLTGFLHDVVEDTHITVETITNLFGVEVGEAVDAISKRVGETRNAYLTRCASNKIARLVKLHDAMFNATNCFKNKNKSKFNYYLETIAMLKAM